MPGWCCRALCFHSSSRIPMLCKKVTDNLHRTGICTLDCLPVSYCCVKITCMEGKPRNSGGVDVFHKILLENGPSFCNVQVSRLKCFCYVSSLAFWKHKLKPRTWYFFQKWDHTNLEATLGHLDGWPCTQISHKVCCESATNLGRQYCQWHVLPTRIPTFSDLLFRP